MVSQASVDTLFDKTHILSDSDNNPLLKW